jgi:uncharacterized repeat protein (TIGR03803 family)
MRQRLFATAGIVITFAICISAFSARSASAQTETVIHTFQSNGGGDGSSPLGGLVADGSGALYGTATGGGKYRSGVVYKLSPPSAQGGTWKQNILYSFMGEFSGSNDGATPSGSIVLNSKSGKIYGTTQGGGQYGWGTVYELSPPTQHGSPWTETILYNFPGRVEPIFGLVADAGGRLYGTTYVGGRFGAGSVFRLLPPALPGGPWTEGTLYNFNGSGSSSQASPLGVVVGASGELYGAAGSVGSVNGGVVFQLSPPSGGKGPWIQTVMHTFTGENGDGFQPSGCLILDADGDVYGATAAGGQFGSGAIYELITPPLQGGAWTENVLYSFTGVAGGYSPVSSPAFDRNGSIYGVTQYGGISTCGDFSGGCGTVYKLNPPSVEGGAWTEQMLYAFTGGSDGDLPQTGVTVVGLDIYGTTLWGGAGYCQGSGGPSGCGTVFQIAQP